MTADHKTQNIVLRGHSMASSTTECRLCRSTVSNRSTVHLFTARGLKNKWASRISTILSIPVEKDERVSPHVCCMCTRRIETLERAAADLQAFKELAKSSLDALQSRGPLKRTRVTSGEVGVSPDTVRARPSSKLSRRQLTFQPILATSSTTSSIVLEGSPCPSSVQGIVQPPRPSSIQGTVEPPQSPSSVQGMVEPLHTQSVQRMVDPPCPQGRVESSCPSSVQGTVQPPPFLSVQRTVEPLRPSSVQGMLEPPCLSSVQGTFQTLSVQGTPRPLSVHSSMQPVASHSISPVNKKCVTVS